jgi:geranylgeranyl pyrophosphate synthase
LLDDVQDEDLEGKPHAAAGPAIASNNALALLFLALRELTLAVELEQDQSRRLEYLRLLNRVSVAAVAGQHRDLMGDSGAQTPEEVLEMAAAKTSSLSLLTECGALLAGSDAADRLRYRSFGETLARYVQVRDDIRDVFGKPRSPDLETGKVTHLLACFAQVATQAQRDSLEQLRLSLPASLPAIRELLYSSGAVAASAAVMEQLRQQLHHLLAATGNHHGAHRLLLELTDGIASTVYSPPPIDVTRGILFPTHGWHGEVRDCAAALWSLLCSHAPPPLPEFRPWGLPQWMYVPQQQTIYYPDLEDFGPEILAWQAELLGEQDEASVMAVMRQQLPTVVAHELFHYWRDAAGMLSHDHWHEEWAANSLAVALAAQHFPEALAATMTLASKILLRHPGALTPDCEQVLTRCSQRGAEDATGYAMEALPMALTTLEMVRRLASTPVAFERCVEELLTQPSPQSGVMGSEAAKQDHYAA